MAELTTIVVVMYLFYSWKQDVEKARQKREDAHREWVEAERFKLLMKKDEYDRF